MIKLQMPQRRLPDGMAEVERAFQLIDRLEERDPGLASLLTVALGAWANSGKTAAPAASSAAPGPDDFAPIRPGPYDEPARNASRHRRDLVTSDLLVADSDFAAVNLTDPWSTKR